MKYAPCGGIDRDGNVAPHTGAWIEIVGVWVTAYARRESPPTRGRGLKFSDTVGIRHIGRRPPHGGVD